MTCPDCQRLERSIESAFRAYFAQLAKDNVLSTQHRMQNGLLDFYNTFRNEIERLPK